MPINTPGRTRSWRLGSAVAFLLSAVCVSCSREAKPPLHPVRGTVTVRGEPAVKAIVVLRPSSPGPPNERIPHGVVGPDGAFVVGTYADADGAPAGEYTVTITWQETRKDSKTGDEISDDRLKGRHADPAKSRWKVTIKEGDNQLEPFRLD